MGDKKWFLGGFAVVVVAYLLAARFAPLEETTVALDRTLTVAADDGSYCSEARVLGEATFVTPYGILDVPGIAPQGYAVSDPDVGITMQATTVPCDGYSEPQAEDTSGNSRTAGSVQFTVGDAACPGQVWAMPLDIQYDVPSSYTSVCGDDAVRSLIVGSSEPASSSTYVGQRITLNGGCLAMEVNSVKATYLSGANTVEWGPATVDRICPGDAS